MTITIYTIIILVAIATSFSSIIDMLEGKKKFHFETVLLFVVTFTFIFFLN